MNKKPGPPKLYPVRIQLQIDEELLSKLDWWRFHAAVVDWDATDNISRNAAIREAIRRMVD